VRATHFVYCKVDRTDGPYHTELAEPVRTERGKTGTALRGAHGAERDLAAPRECGPVPGCATGQRQRDS
jgi:hypothetical protein